MKLGISTSERGELAAARRRIRELETELALVKQEAALFEEGVRPKDTSPVIAELAGQGFAAKQCSGSLGRALRPDPYTYLRHRPFRPTPEASFEGGLDVLVGQTMSAVRLTRALTGMLSHLPRPAYPGLPVLHDEEAFTLSSDVPLAFQLDGEYLGDFTTVAFERLEGALTVIAPAPAAARRAGR